MPPVSVSDPAPDRPVGGSGTDEPLPEWIIPVMISVVLFVVSLVVFYFVYLFIGVILGDEIVGIIVLGVIVLGYFFYGAVREDTLAEVQIQGIKRLLSSLLLYGLPIVLAYGLLLFFVVWASGQDRPTPGPGEDCRIEDRGGRIREVCR
jgi:hypothetical protein